MFLSSSETFNYWTLWFSSVVPPVLTPSSKVTRPKRQRKGFFPYEWYGCPEKVNNKELPPYDSFFSILRNNNPLEKEYNDFQNLVYSGLTTEQAVAKLRMDRILPTGAETYSYLQIVWENNGMQFFSDFLKCYNNKDAVQTLGAMQNLIEFYHNKGIDMLKLGCTLPNLAYICLHKSTDSKLYRFRESDKDLLEMMREDTGCLMDAYWMPTGLYTQREYDSETKRLTARQNKSRSFENMVLSYLQRSRPDCKIESNVTTARQKKVDCFSVVGFCYQFNTVFDATGCLYHYCPCQGPRPSRTDTDIEKGVKKRQQDEMRRDYIQQKGYKIVEMWQCDWWSLYKTDASVTGHLRENFPYKVLWVKNNSCKEPSMGDSLVMLNVILRCLDTCATTFPTSFPYSKMSLWVGMLLVIWWNSTQKRKILWFKI